MGRGAWQGKHKEIPKVILDNVEIISFKEVDEVLKIALTKELKPVKWAEVDQLSIQNDKKTSATSTH